MVGLVMLRAGVSSVSSVFTLVATAANCLVVSTSSESSSSAVTRGRVFITDLECEIVESQQHTKSISKRQCAYQKLDWEKLNWTSDQNSFKRYISSWNCCHKYKYKSINLVSHKNCNWRNHQFFQGDHGNAFVLLSLLKLLLERIIVWLNLRNFLITAPSSVTFKICLGAAFYSERTTASIATGGDVWEKQCGY